MKKYNDYILESKDVIDIDENTLKNKYSRKFYNELRDYRKNFIRYAPSIYTIQEISDKIKKTKEIFNTSKRNLSKESQQEFQLVFKYGNSLIEYIKDMLKAEKEMKKKLDAYGHSSSYIDNRQK